MFTHCAVAVALTVTPAALAAPLVPTAPAPERAPRDPANWAHCRWGAVAHTHDDAPRGAIIAPSTTLIENGPSANRIDLVVVGDGYTAGEMDALAEHAQRGVDDLFSTMPFSMYEPLFNVHRVDVVSPESGVDGDPTQDVLRDTALDMRFWCGGTERLLCVNTQAARQAAENAPDVDQIFAVANSAKYGGAGYTSQNIGTYSGANASAAQVAIHELGHSLGNLADEYTYGGPATYTGPEPSARNVSIYNASQMAAQQTKWSEWLGVNDTGFDGVVDAYEGANYSQGGIYRPTTNSMMRSLGREFNLPSVESLIIEMWKTVRPIDSHTSNAVAVYGASELEVIPAAPFLKIQWFLNGVPVGDGRAMLDLTTLTLPIGPSSVRVEVVDDTVYVRDETARSLYMRQSVEWAVEGNPADVNGDGAVNGVDLAVVIASWGSTEIDFDGDGICAAYEISAVLAAWD